MCKLTNHHTQYRYAIYHVSLTFRMWGCSYRWFSWGVASLPEGKSRDLYLAQVCAEYRPSKHLRWVLTISVERWKKLLLTRWKVHCTAASWSRTCPPEVGRLIGIWKPSICSSFVDWVNTSYVCVHWKLPGKPHTSSPQPFHTLDNCLKRLFTTLVCLYQTCFTCTLTTVSQFIV